MKSVESEFFAFDESKTGLRRDRVIAWMPGETELSDQNGHPYHPLEFTVSGIVPGTTTVITINDPNDIKRFLAGIWSKIGMLKTLMFVLEDALDFINAQYSDGEMQDPRAVRGDDPDMDQLRDEIVRVLALARGESVTPR